MENISVYGYCSVQEQIWVTQSNAIDDSLNSNMPKPIWRVHQFRQSYYNQCVMYIDVHVYNG